MSRWSIRFSHAALSNFILITAVVAADNTPRLGLVATYRDTRSAVIAVDPTISFALKENQAPRPEIDPAQFTITWTGTIEILRPGRYIFGVDAIGGFRLTLDAYPLLDTTAEKAPTSTAMELSQGRHQLQATFTKSEGQPARVDFWWESSHFAREPVPWSVLSHDDNQRSPALDVRRQSDHGRFLFEELSCIACHRAESGDAFALGLTPRRGPDLTLIGQRTKPEWIDAWLADPQAFRAHALMPRLFTDDPVGQTQRRAVTAYLESLNASSATADIKLTPDQHRAAIKNGETLYRSTGCIVCHGIDVAPTKPVSDAIIPIGPIGSKTDPASLKAFLMDPAKVDPSGRMPSMSLTEAEAQDLAVYLCALTDRRFTRAMSPPGDLVQAMQAAGAAPDAIDQFKKLNPQDHLPALGRYIVQVKNCLACHDVREKEKQLLPASPAAQPFAQMAKIGSIATKGCLSPNSKDTAPRFDLSPEDRRALQVFLNIGRYGANANAPAYAAKMTLQRFRCIRCHQRDHQGGLDEAHFNVLSQYGAAAAEDTEAVSPPPLTGVGRKLRPAWLDAVLTAGARARPWMSLRMPQFGKDPLGALARQLAAADGAIQSEQNDRDDFPADHIQIGRQLVGNKGFSCITCHDMAGHRGPGSRGPDLAGVKRRIQYDWWKRWLMTPQRIVSGTRMPSFFTDRVSPFHETLGGDVAQQMDAMWTYLSLGQDMPLPAGVGETGQLEVAVNDKPQVFRAFIPGAGLRGIAIGYPQGLSLAFDAQHLRFTQAWTGGFIDATGSWEGRGGANIKLLGPVVWNGPAQFPWKVLSPESDPAAWPSDANAAAIQFKGYTVADTGPTFRYQLTPDPDRPIAIEDRPVAIVEAGAVGFSRQLTATGLTPDRAAWLLVAEVPAGQTLETKTLANQTFVIVPREQGRSTIHLIKTLDGNAQWQHFKEKTHNRAAVRLTSKGDENRAAAVLYTFLTQDTGESTLSRLANLIQKP